jgi:hypothetical protein
MGLKKNVGTSSAAEDVLTPKEDLLHEVSKIDY